MVPISNDQNGLEGEKMERFYVAILQLHRLTKVAFLSFFCCFIIDIKAVYAAATAEKKPPTQEDMQDYFSRSRKGISDENLKKAEQLRLKTIDSIEKLLLGQKRGQRKFELFLRLGELHAERHDYLRDLEMRQYDISYSQWEQNGKKGREPKLSNKESKAALLKSVSAFRKLVREYPQNPRTDAALFSLAKTLLRLDNENAVLYFNQILKSHKNSPLLPDVYLALGEYYFYKHNISNAISNYKLAMKYKASKVYPYAVYKLGWSYFNAKAKDNKEARKNIDKAIAAFKLVVALSEKDREDRNLNLRQEAINDLIVVFAENERTKEAFRYFSYIGEDLAFYEMLEKLGNTYADNGENAKAISVYNRILTQSMLRPSNPKIHLKVAELYDANNQTDKAVDTLVEMNKRYVAEGAWSRANSSDKSLVSEAKELVRKNIHRFSAAYHKLGYDSKRDAYLLSAAKLYQIYLGSFSETSEAYELRYYLADIYFHFKKYDAAANEYYRVSRIGKNGKYLKDAALNAVVAMSKIDEKMTYKKLPPIGQVEKSIPLPEVKKKLLVMMDNYVHFLPEDKESFAMRFSVANTLFQYGHYRHAMNRFNFLAKNHPEKIQGQSAIKMMLGFYVENKSWDDLIKLSRTFLANKKITKSGLKGTIVDNLKLGVFELAVELSEQKRHDKSAAQFVQYQIEFPKDKLADDALFNATSNYYKAGEVEEAIKIGKVLLSRYPNSPHNKHASLDIAQSNEALANFQEAAKYYKAFGLNYPREKEAKYALYNAAVLYKGVKSYDEATELFKKFTTVFKKDPAVKDAYFQIADILERQRKYKRAIPYYDMYSRLIGKNSESGLYASAKAAVLASKFSQNDADKRFGRLKKELLKPKSLPAYEARRIVAAKVFDDMELNFKDFDRLRIKSAETIEKDVAKMQSKLMRVVKGYENLIELGSGEYTVASLYRMGEMHDLFAKELFNAPAPTNAGQQEINEYRTSIEKVAFPLKDESTKFFEVAYQRSKEVQTFSNWTVLAREKMANLDSEKYPLIGEKVVDPEYLSHRLYWDSAVASIVE